MEQTDINIETEIDEVKKQIELLSATDGWTKLSERQRKYIKDSLYVSKRAYREYGITNNPRYGFRMSEDVAIFPIREDQKGKFNSKYTDSQDRISNWYCHYSVFVLENDGKEPNPEVKKVDAHFKDEKFAAYTSFDELEAVIKEVGFPCVVQITDEANAETRDMDDMIHSILVLGKDDGGYITWEKRDLGQLYEVRRLNTIFENNNDEGLYWGVRPLRKLVNYFS